ncbi:transposase [Ohtaekwangia sp.]|uniref:transposase n=1 Tax=Ohtaekwangia sp. TaxID=2066019 RepID=UPI0039C9194A
MKPIYTANKDLAWTALETLEDTWGQISACYKILESQTGKSCHTSLIFPLETRTTIYTTTIIENLNGKIRKYTKTKMSSR